MPKPTAAPTVIQTPASIAQITIVMPSSSRPWWARRRPSVARGDRRDAARAASRCGARSASRRRRATTPTTATQRDQLDRVAADLAEQAVADDDEDHEQHGDVEQPLGHQRADDGALGASARAAPSARRGSRRPRGRAGCCCPCSRRRSARSVSRAARRRALVDQQPLPALRADDASRARRGRSRRSARRSRPRVCGSFGASWWIAHQTTAPSDDDRDDDPEQRTGASDAAAGGGRGGRLAARAGARRWASRCSRGRSAVRIGGGAVR